MMKLFKLPVKIERKAKVICLILFCSLAAFGQVQVTPFPLLKANLLDANGKPLAAGCVNFYAAGTTTPQATYVDSTGIAQNPNPIVLDAAGRVPSGSAIWLSSAAYKIRVFSAGSSNCASGTLQWEIDNFRTFSTLGGTETLSNKTLTSPTLTSPTSTGTDSGTETLVNKTLTSPTITSPTTSNPTITSGVNNNGSGFKHIRVAACTINNVACNTLVTWTTPFADTNYTSTCTYLSASQSAHISNISGKTAASMLVAAFSDSGNLSVAGEVDCIAVHD